MGPLDSQAGIEIVERAGSFDFIPFIWMSLCRKEECGV